jgi:ATP-binding cassette subfamily B protein
LPNDVHDSLNDFGSSSKAVSAAVPSQSSLGLFRPVMEQARPFWLHLAGIFLLSLVSIPLALLAPLPLKIAVDSVIGSQPLPSLLQALLPPFIVSSDTVLLFFTFALCLAIAGLIHVQGLGIWMLSSYTGERLILHFRRRLFEHMQRLSISYHETKGAADSMYRLHHDASCIKQIPIDGVIPFTRAVCMLVGTAYITMVIDWVLAAIALALTPILMWLTNDCGRRLRKKWAEVKHRESSMMTIVQEVLGAFRVVKAYGREQDEQMRFMRQATHCMRGHNRLAGIGSGFDFAISMVITLGTATALLVGVRHVQAGSLTLGELLLVMAYLSQLTGPLETLTKKVAELQSCLASAERAFAFLATQPNVIEKTHARPLARALGHVAFDRVSFAYDGVRVVLRETSFMVRPGTRVGIVGRTGAGKTTLLNLLTRFYDPDEGRILLDGVDVRDYRVTDLRRQFAIVLQEPVLFSTTIAENIGYGRTPCTFDEIVRAAQAAHAHEFIMRLPEGYDTRVGERGAGLSGGERQRISLARTFLRDAPILLLDEPTSSLDVHTEDSIIDAMETLMRGRTTFLIAHRLRTLRNCDVQLVIDEGRVVALDPLTDEMKAISLHG